MTNHELFLALNHTRTEYLEQSEQAIVKKRRGPVRLVLVAAAAALLTGSVLAGILMTNYIDRAEQVQTNCPAVVQDLDGRVQVYEGFADVNLTLAMSEERPLQITESMQSE